MENKCQEMDDKEFPGHLIHQAVHWDNPDLLQDLLSGEQVSFLSLLKQDLSNPSGHLCFLTYVVNRNT